MCVLALQLIIPGSGLQAGSGEANKTALPAYAGVEGVEQVETQSNSSESGGTSDDKMMLPHYSGAAGVKQ